MVLAGVSNGELAKGTGYSRAYVAQVRSGSRRRVSIAFLTRAGNHLGALLAEPGRLAAGIAAEPLE